MSVFSKVFSLIKTLSTEEQKVARAYLLAFETARNEESLKSVLLFDLLANRESKLTEEDAKSHLYKGNNGKKTFYRLITRFHDKVLESLITDININRAGAYSEQYRVKFGLRKKTIQASILLGKGLYEQAWDLFEKIIAKCKEFEVYDELIETLYLKQQSIGLRNGKAAYEKITDEISFYEECRKALYRTRDIYHSVIINNDFKANSNEADALIQNSILELQGLFVRTNSKNISYYLHYILMEFYQRNHDYQEAKEAGISLIELISNNRAIYMKRSLGSAYIELANNYLYTLEFDEALKACEDSYHLHPSNGFNYSVAKEIAFYAAFYGNQAELALQIIDELLDNQKLTQSEYIRSKRTYLKACVMFKKKEFKQVKKLLQQTKLIESDKEGWNVGVRTLAIMNDIESDSDRLADSKIESARKHLQRLSSFTTISKRNAIIRKVLNDLSNYSFDFKKLYKSKPDQLNNLSDLESEIRWQIKSPEMIKFHDWFFSKI